MSFDNVSPTRNSFSMSVNKFGYELQVPSDLKMVTSNSLIDLFIPGSYFESAAIKEAEIELTPGSKKCDSFPNHIKRTDKIRINGHELERQVWSGEAAGSLFQGVDYNFFQNGLCYQVRLYTHSEQISAAPAVAKDPENVQALDMKKAFALADSIVSSFRFTDFK
jgi:hypothetical protein